MTELFGFRRRQVLRGAVTTGIAALLAGCSGILGGSEEQEHYEEPDEPPETVADGFDIEVAYETTVDAIHERTFEVFGHVSYFTDGTAGELDSSRARLAKGDVENTTARHIYGSSDETELTDDPLNGDRTTDNFYRDGEVLRRSTHGDTKYDRDEAQYSDFTSYVESEAGHYAEPGTLFEFGEPEWDARNGVYVVEGTDLDDEEVTEDVEIEQCEVHVDRDGVVVGVKAELVSGEGEVTRTNVDGNTGDDITVEAPDWISEV